MRYRSSLMTRTSDFYWQSLAPEIRASFSEQQATAVQALLEQAAPRPNPKLVDLRFTIDLVLSQFYVVLLVGKDRRQQKRSYSPHPLAQTGNLIAAIVLLVGLNLLISLFILLLAYLTKSAVGLDLVPGQHLGDQIKKF